MLLDEVGQLFEMRGPVFNLTATQFTLDEGISAFFGVAAVCYTMGLSRYSTAAATINPINSPVVLTIGDPFDPSFSTVEFPIIKLCYSAGYIDKPVTDYLKSGFRNCGQIRHHFLVNTAK